MIEDYTGLTVMKISYLKSDTVTGLTPPCIINVPGTVNKLKVMWIFLCTTTGIADLLPIQVLA